MKILFVMSGPYLPQNRGGTETNTHELCIMLQSLGHSVAVLAGISGRTWFGIQNRARCFTRLSYCCPPDDICGYPVFRSRCRVADVQESLDEVLMHYGPNVVITQLGESINLAQQARLRGFPAAVYIHDVSFSSFGKPSPQIRFLSNSKFTALKFHEAYGLNSSVVYNLFHPEKYRAELRGEHVTFVNPHQAKGAETAFFLANRFPDIPFLFVGSWYGPPDKKYRRRAKAAPNINWVLSTPDMRGIYEKTRILIVPSHLDETWGRVVTEGQFSGIPVLASDRGALPESVGDGGILLPDDNLEAWQMALEDLWYNDQRWRGFSKSALRNAARPELRPSTVIGRFLDILEQIRSEERLDS